MTKPVLSLLERNGQVSYRRRGLLAIARAFNWTPDAIDQILAGGDPDQLRNQSIADLMEARSLATVDQLRSAEARLAARIDELEMRLDEQVERAVTPSTGLRAAKQGSRTSREFPDG